MWGLITGDQIEIEKGDEFIANRAQILAQRIPAYSSSSQTIHPVILPICRAKLGALTGQETGLQYCMIWVLSQQTTQPIEPVVRLTWAGKQIFSPTELFSMVFSPSQPGSLARECRQPQNTP